jgi:hypothetical protein
MNWLRKPESGNNLFRVRLFFIAAMFLNFALSLLVILFPKNQSWDYITVRISEMKLILEAL